MITQYLWSTCSCKTGAYFLYLHLCQTRMFVKMSKLTTHYSTGSLKLAETLCVFPTIKKPCVSGKVKVVGRSKIGGSKYKFHIFLLIAKQIWTWLCFWVSSSCFPPPCKCWIPAPSPASSELKALNKQVFPERMLLCAALIIFYSFTKEQQGKAGKVKWRTTQEVFWEGALLV